MDYQEQAEELIQLLSQLSHRPDYESAELVTRGEGALLTHLALYHNGATAGELRRALEVGSGRVANALKSLEAKALITRTSSAEDGRVVQVFLTPKGRELILARHQHLLACTGAMLETLGDEDSQALLRIVRKLSQAARQPQSSSVS